MCPLQAANHLAVQTLLRYERQAAQRGTFLSLLCERSCRRNDNERRDVLLSRSRGRRETQKRPGQRDPPLPPPQRSRCCAWAKARRMPWTPPSTPAGLGDPKHDQYARAPSQVPSRLLRLSPSTAARGDASARLATSLPACKTTAVRAKHVEGDTSTTSDLSQAQNKRSGGTNVRLHPSSGSTYGSRVPLTDPPISPQLNIERLQMEVHVKGRRLISAPASHPQGMPCNPKNHATRLLADLAPHEQSARASGTEATHGAEYKHEAKRARL